MAPTSLGTASANLTSNGGTTPYVLFNTSGETEAAAALDLRVAYNITRSLSVEGGVALSRPTVNFTVWGDAEGATGFTAAGERMSQMVAEVAAVYSPRHLTFGGGRARPFLAAGVGVVRQWHGQVSATSGYFDSQTGQTLSVGGGVKYFFATRRASRLKAFGLRADARAVATRHAFAFGGHLPVSAMVGLHLVAAF